VKRVLKVKYPWNRVKVKNYFLYGVFWSTSTPPKAGRRVDALQ